MDNRRFCGIVAVSVMCLGAWAAGAQTILPGMQPPASKAVPPQSPSSEEQEKLLEEMRQYTTNYTQKLPDFICLEQTFRYVETTGTQSWRLVDVLAARLSYFDQKEDYKLVSRNGRAVPDVPYASLGGAFSMGDFGTHMREVFDPANHATFTWKRWTTLRDRLTHVFSYRVPLEFSTDALEYRGEESAQMGALQRVKVAYRGS